MELKFNFYIKSEHGYWCNTCEDWKPISQATPMHSYERAEQHLPLAFSKGGCQFLQIEKIYSV